MGNLIPADGVALDAGWAKCARCHEVFRLADTPHSVEIIYENGSFRLPCNSPAEQTWVIAEINDFLQTVPYRPSPYPDPYTNLDGGWPR